jgi:hypothetical protein
MIATMGEKEDTLGVAGRMLRAMRNANVAPDVVFFNALIAHAAKAGKLRSVLL